MVSIRERCAHQLQLNVFPVSISLAFLKEKYNPYLIRCFFKIIRASFLVDPLSMESFLEQECVVRYFIEVQQPETILFIEQSPYQHSIQLPNLVAISENICGKILQYF